MGMMVLWAVGNECYWRGMVWNQQDILSAGMFGVGRWKSGVGENILRVLGFKMAEKWVQEGDIEKQVGDV